MNELLPIGIYTIPEISFVGRNEEELTAAADPVRGRDLALPRARARPDPRRHLRDAEDPGLARGPPAPRRARARHERDRGRAHRPGGDGHGGTLDYLVDTVFNYPTLAESYKVAALDAQNRMLAVERLEV